MSMSFPVRYVLVSVPETDNRTFARINEQTNAADLSVNSRFTVPVASSSSTSSSSSSSSGGVISSRSSGPSSVAAAGGSPGLKVGTLDKLMALSKDLEAKHEAFAQSTTERVVDFAYRLLAFRDVLPEGDNNPVSEEEWRANARIRLREKMRLTAQSTGGDQWDPISVETYIEKFEWNRQKYNYNLYPTDLVNKIVHDLSQIDADLKKNESKFSKMRQNLEASDKRMFGNLMQKPLWDVVLPIHFPVEDSEHLVTLLFCVPLQNEKIWFESYENLVGDEAIDQYVVPGSSQVIARDKEFALVNVTLFEMVADQFKKQAQKKRFLFRDFEYKSAPPTDQGWEGQASSVDPLRAELVEAKKRYMQFCEVAFSDAFMALMHVKAVRLFVESILRYGLPPNFIAICMKVRAGQEKKLQQKLDAMFRHLDQGDEGGQESDAVIPASLTGLDDQTFRPYVCLDVRLDFK